MTAGMDCRELAHAVDFERVARHNKSRSSISRIFVFAILFIVSVGIVFARGLGHQVRAAAAR